jgi:PAS domain S-box-containing protein
MNFLDIRTVLVSSVISGFICMVVMLSLWLRSRRRSTALGFWMADFVMQFAAMLLIALRGVLPDFISMVVGNALVIGGTLFLYIGLERYLGKTSRQWPNYIYLAAFILTHTYFAFVQPSLPARNINLSLGLLVVCSQCAWLLLRRVDSAMRSDTRSVGMIFTAYSLVSLVRIFVDLVVPRETDLFKSGLYDVLAILIYQMLFVGLTFALFLMVNRRLFAALEADIAERHLAEAALKKSEEKFSIAFQNIPDAITITSLADGKIIEVNESFIRITGYTREETSGKTTLELNLWGSLAERTQFIEQLQQQGRALNFEATFRKKSGEVFPGLVSAEIIRLREVNYVLSVIQDFSERKQVEEEIRRLSKFPAENPNPVLRIERAGRILYANPASAPILAAWDRNVGQDAPEDWRTHIADVFVSGKPREFEMNYQGKIFLCNLTPVLEEEYVNLYGLDITERKQAEDALRESEERLKLAQQSSNTGWWDWDMATGQLKWSQELFELFGLDPETARATFEAWDQVMHPDDKTSAYELLDIAVKNGTYLDSEYRVIQPGGQIKWVRAIGRASYDPEQKPVRMTGICIDITARKQTEEALRASEERFRRAVLGAPFPIMLHAEDGEVVTINTPWTQLTGYEHSDIPTIADWTQKAYGTRMDLVRADIDSLYALDGPKAEGEYTIMTRSGQTRTWDFSSAPIGQLPDGRRLVISMAMDVTERKQAEDALRESEDKFKYIFEYSVVGKSITQISGGMQVNKALCDMLGYSLQEMQEKKWQEITHPNDIELTKSHVELLVSGKQDSTRFVKRFIHKNGSIVWVDLSSTIRRNGQNKPLYLMSAVIDITERKQAEDEIKKQLDELRRWQNATLGREGRILDLKREVNELLGKASQPPRYPSAQNPKGLQDL